MSSDNIVRQIVLDTETTGMNMGSPHYLDHKIIEIGAIEIINRRLTGNHFHVYIKPDRTVDAEAYAVHGISDKFLQDKPEFCDIARSFFDFVKGAELIIHNAPFDIGFIDYEFSKLSDKYPPIEEVCKVIDTLVMARRLFPGKRNNLNILCERYHIDNSRRTLHGALLDAEILAEVYLAMTGGQTKMTFHSENIEMMNVNNGNFGKIVRPTDGFKVILASEEELKAHEQRLDLVAKKGSCLWRTNDE